MSSKQNLQPLLDATQNQANLVLNTSDSLDAKGLGILGFNIAITIFAVQSNPGAPWWLLVTVFMSFCVSSVLDVMIIWPRDYIGPSVDLARHPLYLRMPEQQLILQLIADTQKAIKTNSKPNLRKSRYCTSSLLLSLTGILLLIACIL